MRVLALREALAPKEGARTLPALRRPALHPIRKVIVRVRKGADPPIAPKGAATAPKALRVRRVLRVPKAVIVLKGLPVPKGGIAAKVATVPKEIAARRALHVLADDLSSSGVDVVQAGRLADSV